jgi:hypothetical protein
MHADKPKTGEQLSFTGYLISNLAHAVDEEEAVQPSRKDSKKLSDLTIWRLG